MALPSNVDFGTVTGVALRTSDGAPVGGVKFTFTPSLTPALVKVVGSVPPVMVRVDPVVGTTDEFGVLCRPDGDPGVVLPASSDADLTPSGWTWVVTTAQTNQWPRTSATFVLTPNQVVDLTGIVSVSPSLGVEIAAWTAVVNQVTSLRDQTAVSATNADTARAAAVVAKDAAVVAKNAAEAVPTTTDGLMTTIDGNPATAYRVQSDARLSNAIATATAGKVDTVTRQGIISTGAGTSTVTTFPSKGLYRVPFRLPRTSKRYRVRYHNHNAINGITGAQPVVLNVAIGIPAYDAAGALTGNFAGNVATQIVTNAAAGGVIFYSAWFDVSTLPLPPGSGSLASVHVSTTEVSNSRSWMRSVVPTFWKNEAAATDLITGAVTVGSTSPPLGDFGIEVEANDTRLTLFVGDSFFDGFGATTATAVPNRYADLTGIPVASTAVSGGTAEQFNGYADTESVWEKVSFDTAKFTEAVVNLGSNDCNALPTAAQIITSLTGIYSRIRAKGVGRIVGATIAPRGFTGGTITTATIVGATTLVSANYNPGTVSIQVGSSTDVETVTVSAVTGSGPWTLTVPAMVNAHPAGSIIALAGQNEAKRIIVNNWLRNRPAGLLDVIDLDRLYRDPTNHTVLDPTKRFDAVHLDATRQEEYARLIKSSLG